MERNKKENTEPNPVPVEDRSGRTGQRERVVTSQQEIT